MGEFSEKFLRAAQQSGLLLAGTLYERYYGIDYAQVQRIDDVKESRYRTRTSDAFAALCRERAGRTEPAPRRSAAYSGVIIEQQQILTTHNLAVLLRALDLGETLGPRLPELAMGCFVWLCAAQQRMGGSWVAKLHTLKNCAYAWRQMLFFLALLPDDQVRTFLARAGEHLSAQPEAFRERFRPALDGLALAAAGQEVPPAQRFLGWSTGRHWLMPSA